MIISSVLSIQGLGVEAAVDRERRAGDVGCRRACEEGNSRCDLLRLAITSERGGRRLGSREVSIACRVHIGIDRSRLHVVDGDAPWAEIAGPAARITENGGFRCAVVAYSRKGRALADDRADRDDAAAFAHKGRCGPYSGGDAPDIDGKEMIELGKVV